MDEDRSACVNDSVHDVHFFGKTGNVREFDSCQGNVTELIIYQKKF